MGGFDKDKEDDFDKMARADRLKAEQNKQRDQQNPNDKTTENSDSRIAGGDGEITEVKSTQPVPAPSMNIGIPSGEAAQQKPISNPPKAVS